MPNRDFFAFCTSLKPIELKGLGALSRVRHIGAGETIYRAGDPGDTLYIINRGLIEIEQENSFLGANAAYLSRGDIFGDLEVLTGLPRKHLVRTRQHVSLQCFHRDDFPELLRRVPSFFQYLSEQLANRLLQARDAALSQSHCLELRGSLTNFDLVTIYQTIVNSAQTGELSILDEKGELLSAFHFEEGQARGGQFEHLIGEEAFWQLFLADDLRGSFAFTSGAPKIGQAVQSALDRNPQEMLIAALQSRDEWIALREEMPGDLAQLERRRTNLNLEAIAPELRPLAEKIWKLSSTGPKRLGGLYARLTVCELKICRAVQELVASGHCALLNPAAARKVA